MKLAPLPNSLSHQTLPFIVSTLYRQTKASHQDSPMRKIN